MSAPEKAEVVTKVSSSPLPKRKVLRELGIPTSTYYRWLRRQDQQGLEDRPGGDQPSWNRLTIQEERSVLLSAREMPELSCRQLAAWITDNQGFSVSESSVYRILGREGLVKRPEMRLAAGKEYHRKTTGPNQMWATDASYFRVVGSNPIFRSNLQIQNEAPWTPLGPSRCSCCANSLRNRLRNGRLQDIIEAEGRHLLKQPLASLCATVYAARRRERH